MTLGEKIYQLRKQKELSQETLAEQLAISRQAVSKWELGESMPDIENIVQLSKVFNVSTDYLLNNNLTTLTNTTKDKKGVKRDERFVILMVTLAIIFKVLVIGALFAVIKTFLGTIFGIIFLIIAFFGATLIIIPMCLMFKSSKSKKK